jgi:putative DNA primase/helicase
MTALEAFVADPRWVAWRNEMRGNPPKPTKVPYAPDGRRAKADDPSTWGTRSEAEERVKNIVNGLGGGIGIQLGDLGADQHLAGLDLDSCLDAGAVAPWAAAILTAADSYAEISPSGGGLKLFFYIGSDDVRWFLDHIGVPRDGWGCRRDVPGEDAHNHGPAVEVYLAGRYFTVTEKRWPAAPENLNLLDREQLEHLVPLIPLPKVAGSGRGKGGGDTSRSAIAYRKGAALRRAGATYEEMCAALAADPATTAWYAEKGTAAGGRELRRIWDKAAPDGDQVVIVPSAPLDIAKTYVRVKHSAHGAPSLQHHRGEFFDWSGSTYRQADDLALRAGLYDFLAQCVSRVKDEASDNWKQVPVKPNMRFVGNVIDALRAATHLPTEITPPAWLDDADDNCDPGDLIACKNGLLHWPSGILLPHTPCFFNVNAVDFDYQRAAAPPVHWLRFLDQLWPDDPTSIETLQEVFGLSLVDDTSHQKCFLLVGPRRSGKGTIARVLARLIGPANTAAPTLDALGRDFGLQPLINKRLAIIGDARIGPKTDTAAVVERLLSISGEDLQNVNRKNAVHWIGQLRVRFLVITNELPNLRDTSGALAGRFIILALTRSFFGKEDHGLVEKLLEELPAIFNWALAGLHRLRERGHFVPPQSSEELVEELDIMASPMRAFLRDRFEFGPGYGVTVDDAYEAWEGWCHAQHRDHPGTKQTFGIALRTAFPDVKIGRPRDAEGARWRQYEGLRLKR